jgi:hypothetical protein
MGFSKLSSLLRRNSSDGGSDHCDPNQPRVPAGHSGGGRWTRMGALLGGSEERDAPAREGAGPAAHVPREDAPIRLAQLAGSDANRPVFPGPSMLNPLVLQAATLAYRRHAEQAKDGELPVFVFKAREYRREEGKELDLAGVRVLERREAERRCPRTEDIQQLIDKSIGEVLAQPGGRDLSPQVRGTRAHSLLKHKINEFAENLKQRIETPPPEDTLAVRDLDVTIEDLGAEVPLRSDGNVASPGKRGSVRLDVSYKFKRIGCVVDLKTGERGLDGPRAAKLAARTLARYKEEIDEVLVMEMKPGEE